MPSSFKVMLRHISQVQLSRCWKVSAAMVHESPAITEAGNKSRHYLHDLDFSNPSYGSYGVIDSFIKTKKSCKSRKNVWQKPPLRPPCLEFLRERWVKLGKERQVQWSLQEVRNTETAECWQKGCWWCWAEPAQKGAHESCNQKGHSSGTAQTFWGSHLPTTWILNMKR